MEKIDLIGIYGAGGCGRGIAPLLLKFKSKNKIVFIDDTKHKKIINEFECINYKEFLKIKKNKRVVIAIANSKIRKSIFKKVKKDKIKFNNLFDNLATNFGNNYIEEGYLISPFVTIASNVRIGKQFHANLYSYVEHDCVIGNFVTFAPAVRCNGNVVIGDNVHIGSGAIIKNGLPNKPLIIGSNVVVGAGAVVTKNIKKNTTVVGNPAKRLK